MSLQLLFRCAEIDSIIPKTVLWFNLGEREMLGLCNILGIHARQLRITTIDEWRAWRVPVIQFIIMIKMIGALTGLS